MSREYRGNFLLYDPQFRRPVSVDWTPDHFRPTCDKDAIEHFNDYRLFLTKRQTTIYYAILFGRDGAERQWEVITSFEWPRSHTQEEREFAYQPRNRHRSRHGEFRR